MFFQVLEENQETWLDGQPYRLRFYPKYNSINPDQIKSGEELFVQCEVFGPNVSRKMVKLRKNGILVDMTDWQIFPSTVRVLYKGNGNDIFIVYCCSISLCC